MKRYQECSPLEKLWRRRWYIRIPFQWVWMSYIKKWEIPETEIRNGEIIDTDVVYVPKGKNLWRLLIGLAQSKMNWTYSMDEMKEEFKERFENDIQRD